MHTKINDNQIKSKKKTIKQWNKIKCHPSIENPPKKL